MMVSWMCNAGEAETGLERLHQCAEKDLQMFIKAGNTTTCFSDFCSRLAGLTR
jgi:ariadne-1